MKQMISLLIVGAAVAFCALLPASKSDYCDDKISAWLMAKEFVKDRLRAPSTADFPSYDEKNVTQLEECTFLVEGYVDAENAFGGTVRSKFVTRIVYNRDAETFRLERININ